MKERVLKGRKRKPASKGRVIRVSDLVFNTINKHRLNNRDLSHDEYLREVFGLPTRDYEAEWTKSGRPKLLVEGFVEQHSGKFFFDEADANGAMVVEIAKRKTKKALKPVRVREVK